MPLMQDYEVEVEITVTVRNKSTSRSEPELVMKYTTAASQSATSYSTDRTIPAALTKCVDEVHRKAATVARFTRDSESARLR